MFKHSCSETERHQIEKSQKPRTNNHWNYNPEVITGIIIILEIINQKMTERKRTDKDGIAAEEKRFYHLPDGNPPFA